MAEGLMNLDEILDVLDSRIDKLTQAVNGLLEVCTDHQEQLFNLQERVAELEGRDCGCS